jgi:hypothetical protein
VVESQTTSLTPDPSFAHNLGYRCPNKAILDIYASRPFQRYKEHLNARCFDPCNCLLNFREFWRTPTPIFGSVNGDLTLPSKWGCDIIHQTQGLTFDYLAFNLIGVYKHGLTCKYFYVKNKENFYLFNNNKCEWTKWYNDYI